MTGFLLQVLSLGWQLGPGPGIGGRWGPGDIPSVGHGGFRGSPAAESCFRQIRYRVPYTESHTGLLRTQCSDLGETWFHLGVLVYNIDSFHFGA